MPGGVICASCGASNPESNKFCGECGETLVASDTHICKGCGTENPATNRFCQSCGHAMPRPKVEVRQRFTVPWETAPADAPIQREVEPKPRKVGGHAIPRPQQALPGLPIQEHHRADLGLTYWWGVRELAGGFDSEGLKDYHGGPPPSELLTEWVDLLAPLHFLVFVRMVGANHHLEMMRELEASAEGDPIKSVRLIEAFEAFLVGLHAAAEECAREAFILLVRDNWRIPKQLRDRAPRLSLEEVAGTLETNGFKEMASWLYEMQTELALRYQVATQWRLPHILQASGRVRIPDNASDGTLLKEMVPAPIRIRSDGTRAPRDGTLSLEELASRFRNFVQERLERIYRVLYESEFDKYLLDHTLNVDHVPPWDRTAAQGARARKG